MMGLLQVTQHKQHFSQILVVLTVLSGFLTVSSNFAPLTNVTEAVIGTNYTSTLNNTIQRTYFYLLNRSTNDTFRNTNIRLKVGTDKSAKATNISSLSVTIIKPSDISASFRLPTFSNRNGRIVNISNTEKYTAERTICILDQLDDDSVPLSIVLSTRSKTNVNFYLFITNTQDFLLETGGQRNLTISPNTPHFFRYIFEKGLDSVVVLASTDNPTNLCMTLSVQIPVCPIFDQEDNIHYGGIYQTITSSGALTVKKESPFLKGFIIVLIAHPDNEQCLRRDPFSLPFSNVFSSAHKLTSTNEATKITLTLSSQGMNDSSDFLKVMFWLTPVLVAIGIMLLLFFALWLKHRFIRKTAFLRTERMRCCLSFNIRELHMQNNNETEQCKQTSFSYLVFFVGIFYSIPVIQFALYYMQVSIVTGDSDLCYYNYRCAHPVWFFMDFNHIVSNVPYVYFGLMIFVFATYHQSKLSEKRNNARGNDSENLRRRRDESQELLANKIPEYKNDNNGPHCSNYVVHGQQEITNRAQVNEEIRNEVKLGVPFNYDMFKALGIALIVEGILSASYHLCPNEATFQFDTCFMYVIALLTIIHLFQSRHPHCFSPNHAFLTLVFIVIPIVVSIVANFLSTALITGLMICFLVVTFIVSIIVGIDYAFLKVMQQEDTLDPMRIVTFPLHIVNLSDFYPLRLLLPAGHLVMSILVGSYWMLDRCSLSTYILYLLVGNMCWNIFYYILMKILHGEFTWGGIIFPVFYLTLAMGFGATAIYFYLHAAARWELPPAASRSINQDCFKVLGTEIPFDSHDIWHILSATAIFCAFNLLLTLDDDLVLTQRVHIPVF